VKELERKVQFDP